MWTLLGSTPVWLCSTTPFSKNFSINCSVILRLHDDNLSLCTRITHFIELIRHSIPYDLTEQHLDSSQKKLLRTREKISTL